LFRNLRLHGSLLLTVSSFNGGFLADHIKNRVFKRLFILAESVLFPGVVHRFDVQAVALAARLEKTETGLVIGLLIEFKSAAIVHKLFEFMRLASAQVLKGRFNLLFLNVVILFVLGATG